MSDWLAALAFTILVCGVIAGFVVGTFWMGLEAGRGECSELGRRREVLDGLP